MFFSMFPNRRDTAEATAAFPDCTIVGRPRHESVEKNMSLWRAIWELVDGEKPPKENRERSRGAAYFFRVVGVVILVCFMSFCFPSRSDTSSREVPVTPELSYEVVAQMDKAREACRAAEGFRGSSCALEVWKSCHMARDLIENSSEPVAKGERSAAEFLCDAAVVADAGELAFVLASRYGEEYYRQSQFYIPRFSRNPFNLFHDLVFLEFWVLDASSVGYPKDAETSDSYDLGLRLGGSSSNYPEYEAISPETVRKLGFLEDAIRDFFRRYRALGRFTEVWGSVPEVGINPWSAPAVEFQDTEVATEQLCRRARKAVRERDLRSKEEIDSCLSEAASCGHSANRITCSPEAGAAEFERMWQALPAICDTANDIAEQYSSDSCRLAALTICDYQNISSDDPWLGQLISMRDFACATAADTPELRATLKPEVN